MAPTKDIKLFVDISKFALKNTVPACTLTRSVKRYFLVDMQISFYGRSEDSALH